jgi:PTH1 family peptidyl-tRNA hydrolase
MKIKLIVGLGNPGREFQKTFHNAGRLFVLALAGGAEFKPEKNFGYAKNNGLTFVLPDLNMNESGLAVKEAAKKFKAKPEEIIVAQDDSDINLGNWKLSFARNSAGHKGVGSVIKSLGTKNFYRLRFGVRGRHGKAGEFVLKPLGKKEEEALNSAFYGAKLNVIEKLKPFGVG